MNMINDKINQIELHDESNFVSELSNNGGCYSYINCYKRIKNDIWEVKYSTSAEFEFCPITGSFDECKNCFCYDGQECNAESQKITTSKIEEILEIYPDNDNYYWYFYE